MVNGKLLLSVIPSLDSGSAIRLTYTPPPLFIYSPTSLFDLASRRLVFIFDLSRFSCNNKSHVPVSLAVPIHTACFPPLGQTLSAARA